MQVRYVFDSDLQQARGRLALALIPLLAASQELKAEPATGQAGEAWRALYPHLARPLLQPRVQLFHGPDAAFVPHPLQWNVAIDPVTAPAGADEIWVFSPEHAARLAAECPVRVLPAAVAPLPVTAALPLDLPQSTVVFASLAWRDRTRLEALLVAYMQAFSASQDVVLALHLQADEAETGVEDGLLELLETLAARLQLDLDALNLETLIGSLEVGAYAALLQRCRILLAPDEQQAREARSLGKAVVTEPTPAALLAALEPSSAGAQAGDGLTALTQAIETALGRIAAEVDFDARAAAWQADQEQARQGRKQKYSLFHSDYQEPEMQARRQWHARYARMLEDAPGDVLDIGCGSGIFLEIMRDMGLPAWGVDPDPDMVDVCHELGLQALPGDERMLADCQPASLGGIHASHVIEHVDGSRAIALIENAFAALRPGGKLLVRTPNWRNDTVRHEGFWLDITHIRPYPLPLLKQVFEDAGFSVEQMGFEEFGWNDTYIVGRKPGGRHG